MRPLNVTLCRSSRPPKSWLVRIEGLPRELQPLYLATQVHGCTGPGGFVLVELAREGEVISLYGDTLEELLLEVARMQGFHTWPISIMEAVQTATRALWGSKVDGLPCRCASCWAERRNGQW